MTSIHTRRLSGIGSGEHGPELVLLPGWGFSSRVWGAESAPEWLGSLRSIGPVTLVEIDDPGIADSREPWTQLAARLPERAIWLGWSLGGMLAAELAARYPERCLALITLASNACFAARPDWPDAMPTATFQRFYSDFQTSPDTTWRRFLGLCAQQSSATETGACRWNADALPNLRLLDPEAKAGRMQPLDARATLRRLRELQALPHSGDLQSVNAAQPARTQPPGEGRAPTTDERLLRELHSVPHSGDDPVSTGLPAASGDSHPARGTAMTGAEASSIQRLLRGLDVLATLDTRNALAQLRCPTLHLLATGDALVPPGAAQRIAALNPNAQVAIVPGSHALHLSAADAVLEQLRGLLLVHDLWRPQRDKRAVAQSFSRAATSYDAVAHLQQKVCQQLLRRLPHEFAPRGRWLDLGCGTGTALPELAARVQSRAEPEQQGEQPSIVALDLAEGMLQLARKRLGVHPTPCSRRADNGAALSTIQPDAVYICGDAERLPLADASIDGVISSLAVQWCDDLGAVCAELARVLRPGGRAWIATLGPDTLGSLRRAWAEIDDRVHVNRFSRRSEWQSAITASGLVLDHWEERPEVLHYPDILALARELKALGANNLNAGRPTGLTGRQRLAQLRTAYEQYRQPAGLPAEYQVWYLELRRSDPDGASSTSAGATAGGGHA